jgi:hypothetical protein
MAGLESTSSDQRVNSAKIITRSGLQSEELYQKVADLLEAGYRREYEKQNADEMSWMCKALAASGDPKYREMLNEVAAKSPSTKVQHYAKESSELIDTYEQRSQVMNATDDWDEELSSEENRLVNMLKHDDISLRRDAAKIIVRDPKYHKKVYAATAFALSSMFKDIQLDSQYIDTMSWLCKALAVSGDSQYIEILEQVKNNTLSHKLSSYASKALNSLN